MNAVSPPNSGLVATELAYLPIFLGVRGRDVLLIGDGEAAAAKLDLLHRAGARVCHVRGAEALTARHFAQAVLAVDASDDIEINRQSVALARAARVPINVVDRPALCDFILPAILDHAPVIIAVSTGGLAPAIARLIRQRLETAIPAGIGGLAALASRFRAAVAERLTSASQRAHFWERLFDGPAGELVAAGRRDDAAAVAEALIEEARCESGAARLHVLHVASSDPELLTIRAARLIRMADVIFHAPGIGAGIIALGRRDATRLALDPFQPEARGLMARCAVLGRSAVYLKSAPACGTEIVISRRIPGPLP